MCRSAYRIELLEPLLALGHEAVIRVPAHRAVVAVHPRRARRPQHRQDRHIGCGASRQRRPLQLLGCVSHSRLGRAVGRSGVHRGLSSGELLQKAAVLCRGCLLLCQERLELGELLRKSCDLIAVESGRRL